MESRILLVGFNGASSLLALKKVLAMAIPSKVQCSGALQYRGPQLVKHLEKLEPTAGVRVIVGQNADVRWESLLALALSSNGLKQAHRVAIYGNPSREHFNGTHSAQIFPYPLCFGELLLWLYEDQLKPLFVLSKSDVRAAKYFLRIDWHTLKYGLHKCDNQLDQVRSYFGFLDAYPSADSVKSILGEAGVNIFELGEQLRKTWRVNAVKGLGWSDWCKRHGALISGFDAMHSLSPRR